MPAKDQSAASIIDLAWLTRRFWELLDPPPPPAGFTLPPPIDSKRRRSQ